MINKGTIKKLLLVISIAFTASSCIHGMKVLEEKLSIKIPINQSFEEYQNILKQSPLSPKYPNRPNGPAKLWATKTPNSPIEKNNIEIIAQIISAFEKLHPGESKKIRIKKGVTWVVTHRANPPYCDIAYHESDQ